MEQEKRYVDTYKREHRVTKELSRGGQGVVMRTDEPDVALKLELGSEKLTDAEQIRLRNRKYEKLRLLPIPPGLHITLPQAVLRDDVGYVMNLLEEMIPFQDAFDPENRCPAEELAENAWVRRTFAGEEMQAAAENYLRWYTTGGSRRRLRAWRKAAFLVARLHGNGLIYCDFSMNNLFVSDRTLDEDENVWLIDADNLRFNGEPGGAYTPGHCAPEIVRDPEHPQFSFASDSYAFAELLYECLAMQHPFHGSLYEAEDDWDDPIEERIDRGDVPWIMDRNDDTNRAENQPLATELFLSEGLNELFDRCFSEEGRRKPGTRPTMAEWGEELSRLLDCTVACPACGMHFCAEHPEGTYLRCPWCDAAVDTIRVDCFAGAERVWHWVHEKTGAPIRVPLRAAGGRMADDTDAFFVSEQPDGLLLELCGDLPDGELFLQQENEKKSVQDRGRIRVRNEKATVLWVKRHSDATQLRIEVCAEI